MKAAKKLGAGRRSIVVPASEGRGGAVTKPGAGKELPLLMKGPLVIKTLAGEKTQTRRLGGLEAINRDPGAARLLSFRDGVAAFGHSIPDDPCPIEVRCRFRPGDRLWVRETCTYFGTSAGKTVVEYLADREHLHGPSIGGPEQWEFRRRYSGKNCPSIYMPRWASRLTLEITEVRVQRLQDISEEDARAEGVEGHLGGIEGGSGWRNYGQTEFAGEHVSYLLAARESFASLWESIHGAGAWGLNPWCWCISFRRLQ